MNCIFLAAPVERKSCQEEFNDIIQLLRDIKKEIFDTESANQIADSNGAYEIRRMALLKQGLESIQLLLDNSYFHFMFVNNLVRIANLIHITEIN